MGQPSYGSELISRTLAGIGEEASPLTHLSVIESRSAEFAAWPEWVHPAVRDAFAERGLRQPWRHQAEAATLAAEGTHVCICTGTASGKSLAYQLPVLTTFASDPNATALYLSPTKALGTDQLRSVAQLIAGIPEFAHLQPSSYDGDTDSELRQWARMHSRWIFTNPDMLQLGITSTHPRWRAFFAKLRYIVVDECHHYRGVFGSHTALVLQRTLRIARKYGADPVVIGASATVSNPAQALSRLIGEDVVAVTEDASPHGERTVAMWEPGFLDEVVGENEAPVRRSAGSEAARLLADFVIEGARTLCFVRSRRGVEVTAVRAKQILAESAPDLVDRVAAYRAGYLADDRRRLEKAISDGTLLGVATTNALELGVDISGLDAVVVAGYPGTVASFWQQAGRAGRRGEGSIVVMIARDDPLDTYLVHHPDALLKRSVEATVTDPTNPFVLGPHMLCAAAEFPLTDSEVAAFAAEEVVAQLTAEGKLKRRKAGWYAAAGLDPHGDIDIRGGIGGQVLIVDATSSRLLGTVDTARAMTSVYPGAVYLHQGESFVVDELDLDDGLALAHPEEPDWTTSAREVSDVVIVDTHEQRKYGPLTVASVSVEVTDQVVGFLRKSLSGEILDQVPLDLPEHRLATRAVMYTLTPEAMIDAGIALDKFPGALHAAEHAAIGMLGLVATCDRWDIGGLSTAMHPGTGLPTVFVYDGYPGGAGFADRGFEAFTDWIDATEVAVSSCGCASGCPSCVQSPKCGNGNEPLDKKHAITLLRLISRLHD
ncbi:DEAD/DEAH box helicase [Gordonia sp. (in: high G+C Gram-positive bacteria)]|uniref:DEAD/DEAH box helicase n=1 Tax=Gordonia sp. (in: high G+C Gram-positive bacteria) TaxID=84139 RepID=UPI0016A7709A|nr:DEAD/DEAH box helicase [Gordonia sp. (in: high G+C Gram-positive bacteria)]NLG46521.1 DEAD/DEAH box helicase [Gordonia sp. (in: high G+C Gram-positive bacteria)]